MKIRFFVYLTASWFFHSCAIPKPLEGGPKDEKPPVLLSAKPDTLSTRVDINLKEAWLYFDEYIKPLKDTQRQIIMSPQSKHPPIFSPHNLPRKYIGIKFQDSLEKNTTYIINFGESIQDNNEGNKLSSFTYVFSTGKTLDSIKLSGKVRDAYDRNLEKEIIIGLYKADSTFQDSLILSNKPYYIIRADKDGNYQITHIKKGPYMLIVFNDISHNHIYNPKKGKLGFLSTPIDLKKNESFDLRLSKEVLPLKILTPKQIGWGHIVFPFEGPLNRVRIKSLKPAERELFIPAASGDSIDYWYKPNEEAIQEMKKLAFKITKDTFPPTRGNQTTTKKDLFPKKIEVSIHKEKSPDFSLQRINAAVVPNKPVWFESEIPIFSINTKKVKVEGKDATKVTFQIVRDNLRPKNFALDFSKELEASYKVLFDKAAIEDIFGNKNAEMINFRLKLGKESDYGNLEVTLPVLPKKPFWFQLLNNNDKIVEEFYGRKSHYVLQYLDPGTYHMRVIIDENEDKTWNPGDFKLRRQPEPVYFYNKAIQIRAFLDIRESWTLPKLP
ncbi:MAG: Ig-like domain-containing domain [Flavobacteriales bacterium AspAUS03]